MTPAEVIARAVDPGAWGDCDDNPTVRHARFRHQQDAREQAAAILAALRAAGFAVVPREATADPERMAERRAAILRVLDLQDEIKFADDLSLHDRFYRAGVLNGVYFAAKAIDGMPMVAAAEPCE